jgi:hypothetical protein
MAFLSDLKPKNVQTHPTRAHRFVFFFDPFRMGVFEASLGHFGTLFGSIWVAFGTLFSTNTQTHKHKKQQITKSHIQNLADINT